MLKAVTLLAALFLAQVTFRTGVDMVEVTVTVRDASGRFIAGLTPQDFQIGEQGAPQEILAFEHVVIPIVPAAARRTSAFVPLDVVSNEHAGESRVFVLVLDALHVAPQRVAALRRHARQFIAEQVGPYDYAAVLSPGGLASATQEFTNDKARLLAAVDQFSGLALRSATVEREEEKQRAIQSGILLHGGRDPSDAERAYQAESLGEVLSALARDLDPFRGRRKAVLLFSEGIDYNLHDPLGKAQRYGSTVAASINRAIGELMRSNAVLYSIDPRALNSTDDDRLATPLYNQPVATNDLVNPGLEGEYTASIVSLRSFAEPTGGFAVVNTSDFRTAFDRILTESSEYYVIGYSPSRPPKAGEFREISVKVSRPGARVVARRGYTVPGALASVNQQPDPFVDSSQPRQILPRRTSPRTMQLPTETVRAPATPGAVGGVEPELAALLSSALPRAGLPLRVQAIPFKGDGKKAAVQIAVEVAGRALRFVERSGRLEQHIDLALVTVDSRARVANGKSTSIDLKLTSEEAERVARSGVRWFWRLNLAPGRYQVRVAGRARSVTPGAVTCDLEVPRFEDERVGLSAVSLTSPASALMVTRGDAKLTPGLGSAPSLERSFASGEPATAAVEVYVPRSLAGEAIVSARIERPGGLSPLEAGNRTLSGGGQARTEAVVFPLDTSALAPGAHVLRIAAAAAADRVERTVPFEVLALPQQVK